MSFINILSNIIFIFLVFSSLLFGFSVAVNLLVKKAIKNVLKESNKNFLKIQDAKKRKETLKFISEGKKDFQNYVNYYTCVKKIKKTNSIRKIFKIKEKQIPSYDKRLKTIINDLLKGVSKPFLNEDEGYLSFSERQIFSILKTLRERIEKILTSTKIVWLRSVKISFIAYCFYVYGVIEDFNKRPFMALSYTILDFLFKFGRMFSFSNLSKRYLMDATSNSLSSLMVKTILEILGKELAVIYFEKQNFIENKKGKNK